MANIDENSLKTGAIGEKIAERFLMKHEFVILDRNFKEKWGELDIVAKKGRFTYFVEVKTKEVDSVSRETIEDTFPEERIDDKKKLRLKRIIQTYCLQKGITEEDIKVSVVAVLLDKITGRGYIRFYPEIVLE
jgi:putative endonuclease